MASFHKQLTFAKWAGSLPWQFSMQDGLLVLGKKYKYSAQILGSESQYDDSWLWAWANTGAAVPPSLLKASLMLKEYGSKNQIRELTEPKLGTGRQVASEIALVASGLLNVGPFY